MTKSELIERLATQQPHIPAKAVEDAVKEMLEHMASTLAQGERIEIRVSVVFLCITAHHVPDVIRRLAIKWIWKENMFRTLNRVKSCAIAPIFTAKFFTKLNVEKSTCRGAFFISACPYWNSPLS